jgi:membrane-bound inhibitor of C-type lysozyme
MKRFAAALALCLSAVLAGCGGMPSLWPFSPAERERSRAPVNATEYQCDAGKRFYVRYLDNGASAWIIFPEREFRLDKAAGPTDGSRYTNGSAVLEVKGDQANLTDGPGLVFRDCKVPAAK